MENSKWLQWTIELQSLAQAGLAYGKDKFDLERYTRIREISAEMMSRLSGTPIETVKGLFCNAFTKEKDAFEQIAGYINDKNIASKTNFLRCADKTEKTERGIRLYVSKESLFKRFHFT